MALGLDRVGHREVLQPVVQLEQVAVAVPSVAVERQVPGTGCEEGLRRMVERMLRSECQRTIYRRVL